MRYLLIETGKMPKVMQTTDMKATLSGLFPNGHEILNPEDEQQYWFTPYAEQQSMNPYASEQYAIVYIGGGDMEERQVNRALYPVGTTYAVADVILYKQFVITKIDQKSNYVSLVDEEIAMLIKQFGRKSINYARELINPIDLINEETERKELLEWIPMLVKDKLNSLTTAQLRILHYILGYESSEIDTEELMEEFEGYGYSEEHALEIVKMLKRDNFLIMRKPY